MTSIARNSVVVAWAILVALTAVSWWLGTDNGPGVEAATSVILVVAFGKVLLVGHSFMELRHAAPALRFTFAGWSVAICAALVTLYLAL